MFYIMTFTTNFFKLKNKIKKSSEGNTGIWRLGNKTDSFWTLEKAPFAYILLVLARKSEPCVWVSFIQVMKSTISTNPLGKLWLLVPGVKSILSWFLLSALKKSMIVTSWGL